MNQSRIDHDRLFKELLEVFFTEFMELFFPEAYEAIDHEHIKFLQQEIFTDVTRGDKHRVDILVETRLKGEPGIILVHVENQAQAQSEFAERMFIYFSRLYQEHRCRILPIAVFSYPEIRDEPDTFAMKFPFKPVLDFQFFKLELKKQNWRNYIRSNNPVAAALLSKMEYQKQERVQVKLEFLRMLVKMELDPARMTLLAGFFETYLRLNTAETRELEEEMGKMEDEEAVKMMELTTSWEERGRLKGRIEGRIEGRNEGRIEGRNEGRLEGRNEGRLEGKIEGKIEGQAELLLKLLKTKFKDIPLEMENKIKTLPTEKLEKMAEAIFDFKSIDDVNAFI